MRYSITLVAAALLAAGATGLEAQQTVNQTRATSATGTVEVHTTGGRVRVVGWTRNQVQVTGTLSSSGQRLEVEEDAGSVVVRVVNLGQSYRQRDGKVRVSGQHGGGEADLEVRVPARKDVEINAVSANVEVTGIDGTTEAQTVSGGVRVSGGRGREISAASRSGGVDITADAERVEAVSVSGGVRIAGTVRDRIEANSVSGDVNVTATAGEVEAASVSGNVTVASMRGRAEVHSVSGDVRVTGRALSGEFQTVSGNVILVGDLARGANLELTSHSGDVTLALASGASLELQANTFSGSIEADYRGARVTRPSRREARITVGGGDARVAVHTFSGNVKLTNR